MTTTSDRPTLGDIGAEELFEKVLTSSDINPHGRVVIPKAHAVQHFPPLDKEGIHISCQDTFGNQYSFRYHSWINNQSRMYLIEGSQDIQALYNLRMGDSMVFGKLPDGQLVVCGRQREGPPLLPKAPSERIIVTLDRAKRRNRSQLVPYDPTESQPLRFHHQQHQQHDRLFDYQPQVAVDPLVPDFHFTTDGIFRAVPHGTSGGQSRVAVEHGNWTAVVNLEGELYQAFFSEQAAAQQAYEAAAGC